MVMIRCPDCGQTVLDVASSCPKCGRVLIQNPLETHDWASLQECGRCGKHIQRRASICPYCGHHVHTARTVRRTAASVIAAAVIVVGAIVTWRSGFMAPLRRALTPDSTAPATAGSSSASAQTPPRAAEPTAAPIRASVPGPSEAGRAAAGTRPDTVPRPTLSTPAPAPPPAPVTATGTPALTTRWTTDWANVRSDRSIGAPAIRVLRPGEEVAVTDMRAGWWAVYINGRILGYIANSLLQREPPGL